ncbi:unnamed protein product [Candidula unifasciata]|uniref:PRKC apoptosis WT1 regulator protein n=1 Tax=Candidula unifasciata TaxID=100452 RepID=A0A8S3ZFK8_9EUPU|nr:unnamed protein product [Candidula unifasciata]
MDDLNTPTPRNRFKIHQGHAVHGFLSQQPLPGRLPVGVGDDQGRVGKDHQKNVSADGDTGLVLLSHSHLPDDLEFPARGTAARLKDKRSRPNHTKGKLPKDKRKMREKRRSTGVVHCMPGAESTGDSLEDEDDKGDDNKDAVHDTKKNTVYNESGTTLGRPHQASYEVSPSGLDADFENSQESDSIIRQSETNLTLTGQSETFEKPQTSTGRRLDSVRGVGGKPGARGYMSKYSSESGQAGNVANGRISSGVDSFRNITSTPAAPSVLTRYCETSSRPSSITDTSSAAFSELGLARKLNSISVDCNQSSKPRPAGFSVFNPSAGSGQQDKPVGPNHVSGTFKFSRDGAVARSNLGTPLSSAAGYQAPRTFHTSSSGSLQQQSDTIVQLEKQLETQKQENLQLQQAVSVKDQRIAELQKEIELLNKECDDLDVDNMQLQEENRALIRAMSKLTSSS